MHRNFLWKQPTVGADPVILGLVNRKKPEVKIRQRILNLAYQTYLESKQSLFVIGSLEVGPNSEGLAIEINAVRGKPHPGAQADFMANCRFCRLVEARDPNDTVLELVEDVKTKQYTSANFSLKSLADYFSLDIHGKLEGPNCSLDVSMVCFERRLKLQKIKQLPIAKNSVYKMLQQIQKSIIWGWTIMSKGSFNLLCKDDLRQDCSGVWIAGCSTLYNPAIWLICQHFLNSVDRSDILSLVHFDESGDPHFYNVTPQDDFMRTVVFSGIEKTTVTRVFTAKDRLVEIPLTMSYVDDGDFTLDPTKGQTQILDEISKEIEQESYQLRARSGLPQLLSPRPVNQFTPATIGVHKLIPKRITLSPISPPSSSSTPLEKNERRSFPPDGRAVNSEVMELIKKQELEISFLKEQIQMLLNKQNPAIISSAPSSERNRPVEEINRVLPRATARSRSPPRYPVELNFDPLKPYVPESMIEAKILKNIENTKSEQRNQNPTEGFYSQVKKGILKVLNDAPVNDEINENVPSVSFAVPRLDLNKQKHSEEEIRSTIQPRLEYNSLVLSGSSHPSVFINEVTKKYFGKSPQLPTVNKVTGNNTPQAGMLRRVLTAEATKQVLFTDDSQRFLDVDALKNQPKLL